MSRPSAGLLWSTDRGTTEALGGNRVVVLSHGSHTADGRPLDAAELAARLARGTELASIAAPFAAAHVDAASSRITLAADHAGLRAVYATRADGWAAVSTSALELARLNGSRLDVDALGEHRLLGHHLGTGTAFRAVVKLAPGHLWRMGDGTLTEMAYPGVEPVPQYPPKEAAGRHADRLRHLVNGFLDEHPDAVLELSGGLDSRLVLAAIPPRRRAGLRALTLTSPSSMDGAVAAELAGRNGLTHWTVDLRRLTEICPEQAYHTVRAAAVRTDTLGAPLSLAAFDWAERQVEPAPRLGGHGGELARGAYYLQRQHARVEPALVDQLAKWWILGNSAVDDAALDPAFAAASRDRVQRRLREIFAGYDADWLTASDEFYLRERLHRWAGLTLTDAAQSRIVANPLLDAGILALTRAVPREHRSGSRYAAQVLDRLDPELARLRLGSGLRPVALSRKLTLSRQLGENTVRGFALKAVDKVGRRILSRGRPAVGAAVLGALVAQHWRANPGLLEPVLATGLIREDWLARFLKGGVEASPATVDFLVNLEVAVDAGVRP